MPSCKSAWLPNILVKKQNKKILPSQHMSRNKILQKQYQEDFKNCFEENILFLHPLLIKTGHYLCKIQSKQQKKKNQRLNKFCICNVAVGIIIARQLSFINQQMFHCVGVSKHITSYKWFLTSLNQQWKFH